MLHVDKTNYVKQKNKYIGMVSGMGGEGRKKLPEINGISIELFLAKEMESIKILTRICQQDPDFDSPSKPNHRAKQGQLSQLLDGRSSKEYQQLWKQEQVLLSHLCEYLPIPL